MSRASPADSVRARGLHWFEDVLGAVPRELAAVAPAGRAHFALWCAERAMRSAPQSGLAGVAGIDDWPRFLDTLWADVSTGTRHALSSVSTLLVAIDHALAEVDDPVLEVLDHDAVAACVYAARCYATGDAEPARWAATRWLDAVFAGVAEEGQLEDEASHPAVQQALRELRLALAQVQQPSDAPS
jgi:hypothetical protein